MCFIKKNAIFHLVVTFYSTDISFVYFYIVLNLFYFQLIILTLASIAAGARLENIYLPPNAESSGADAGLSTPFEGSAASARNQAEILKYENEIDSEGWHYAYETSDGSKAEQNGECFDLCAFY